MTVPEYDASDEPVPPIGPINVAWVDVVNPLTGETVTIDAFDGGPHAPGETFTIRWSENGTFLVED
jgi:hypothetical protein